MKKGALLILITFICSCLLAGGTKKNFEKGNKYYNQEKYQKALKFYKKAITKNSLDFASWTNSGLCYFQLEQFDKSIECFETALKIDSTSSKVYIYLGDAFSLKKDNQSAIKFYEKANDLGGEKDAKFYFGLGSSYYFNGDNDNAIEHLEKSYELNPTFSETLTNLAWANLQENPSISCKYFREAYELDSLNGRNLNNLGYSHLMCGALETAYEYFLKAKGLEPNNSFVYRNLGLYYKEKGEKELSCEYLQQAIELNIIPIWGKHYILDLIKYCNPE